MNEPLTQRERPRVESLDARILYSADPASAAFDALPGMPPIERRAIDAPVAQACVTAAPQSTAADVRHELVVVDTRVQNWQQLVDDIPRGSDRSIEVILLDPARDGVGQISAALAQRHGLDAVHIVSHGEAGAIQIGTTRLDFDTLLSDATAVARWRLALNSGADLMLYGCDLAASGEGRALVDALSRLTGADVAASTDLTGGARAGGDWVLEYATGGIQTAALAGASDLAAWNGSLELTPTGTDILVNSTITTGLQTTYLNGTARVTAIDGSGNFVVVWNDPANGSDVYARRFDAAGAPLGAQFVVNTGTTSGGQDHVAVAMNSSGAFVVVWQSDASGGGGDGSGYGIFAQRYDASGTAQGSNFQINQTTANDQTEPSVAMDGSGNFVVSWTSANQDSVSTKGVYARRFDASGNALGANDLLINVTTAGDQQHSSVSCDASGNFVVAWDSFDGNGTGVYARLISSAGVAQTGELAVNTYTTGTQGNPAVSMNANGQFVVSWQSNGQEGSYGSYARVFDAAGVAQTGEISLNATTTGLQDCPMVAIDGHGNFLATWESDSGEDVDSWGIYGRLFGSDGTALTGETLINATIANGQEFSSVAWNGTQAVYAWMGTGPGDWTGIFARTFSASAQGINTSIPSQQAVTTESGGSQTIDVVLNTQPTADVTIPISSSDTSEGTVSTSSVTFTAANWNIAQQITVSGVDDAVVDGDIVYSIALGPAVSADPAYSGMDTADIAMTNFDNDVAGVVVTPTSALTTTEAGGAASFGVVLASQPIADVTISIASSDTAEGAVSVSSLTFTAANWNTQQLVTVTGADDDVDDGDVAYSIITNASSVGDAAYNGVAVADVALTNVDNDTAGVLIAPTSGLTTTEIGGAATFDVVLTSQPTADVTISIASGDTTEGAVSAASLTFTAADWNVVRTVTVTGTDDAVDDGDFAYSIVTTASSVGDAAYDGIPVADVALANVDNDTAGVSVSAISGNTTEAGGSATFGVVLASQPTADVTISIASSDTAEGTVSVSSLTFTAANWNTQQFVAVTGADDAIDDGDVAYSIITNASSVGDAGYDAISVPDVSATNVDNDAAGVLVTPASGLTTTEAGAAATFDVVLTSQPTADVTISLASDNAAEGTVSAASLTFTAANWNVVQTVTVTGADDAVDDGDFAYSIITNASSVGDATYNGVAVVDVSVTNVDNDAAGILVAPTSGLTTTEAGGTASFGVVLTSQPTADVVLSLSSSNAAEGTVSASSLTFTAANWSTQQFVAVTGADDAIDDGDVAYSIITNASSVGDATYNGMPVVDVLVANIDDDTAGVVVTPISGLTTTETGAAATFGVVLASQPTADVTISLTSDDTTEGTVASSSLTFTAANWNLVQTVAVTGADDAVDDGDVTYSIVTTASSVGDAAYNGMPAADVALTNVDNDTAGVSVSAISGNTTEAGGTATFGVVLTSQPMDDVTISIASNDTTEGTVATSSLTFTAANWNTQQFVTVTGIDDDVDDGDVAYSIVTGASSIGDATYSGIAVSDITLDNVDDDAAGVLVTPTSGLTTTEAGGTATFGVVLTSQPMADVTISLAPSNSAEAAVSTSSLTFTAANWNVVQIVTVTGNDDSVDDGDVDYSIVTGASSIGDAAYNGMPVADIALTNVDNDTAGVSVSAISGNTTEAGGSATFGVVLASQPTADVTISLSSSNASEGTLSTSSLTFTATNWNVTQTVTVTGVDDAVDDGDAAYSIVTSASSVGDVAYNGIAVADVALTTVDNDTAGILITPTSGLATTEAGGTAGFGVVLTSQPTDDVTISIASSDTTEGTVSVASLTFTAVNWNTQQFVTVTGADDNLADGNVAYAIVVGAAAGADLNYLGLDAADVAMINVDDEQAPTLVLPGLAQINEDASLRLGDAGVSVGDANGDLARIDLAVAHGHLDVDLTGGASIAAASVDQRSISLTGTQAQLVDALSRITYRGDADWAGTDALDVSAFDAAGQRVAKSAVIQVLPMNDAPVVTSASRVDIDEGQALVTSVTSTDVDGDVPHYAIAGGADAVQFLIDTNSGELRLRNAPDAEAPADSDRDNVYQVTVEISDGRGGAARQSLDVSVLGVNEAPTLDVRDLSVPSSGAVTLNQNQIVASDVDSAAGTLTFFVSGVVNGHFELATQPGLAISGFSGSALESGLVTLVHDAGAPPPQFVITVSDGQSSSASLWVQAAVSPADAAPERRGGSGDAQPLERAEPAPALAARAEPAPPPPVAPATDSSRASHVDALPPRASGQVDEPPGSVRAADSRPRAPAYTLPAAESRSSETDEIAWASVGPRRAMLALPADADLRSAQEFEDSNGLRLGLAHERETDEVPSLELGNVVLQTLGIALTAGSVWWALRATGLVTALLASLPAWRQFDFLPVLAEEEADDAPDWSPPEDAEAARDEAAVGRDLFVEGVLR